MSGGGGAGRAEAEDGRRLVHSLRNSLAAADMYLARALEFERHGTDPLEDVRAARRALAAALAVSERLEH